MSRRTISHGITDSNAASCRPILPWRLLAPPTAISSTRLPRAYENRLLAGNQIRTIRRIFREGDRCAFAKLALDVHRAAGLVRETIDLGKTEPATLLGRLGREERI